MCFSLSLKSLFLFFTLFIDESPRGSTVKQQLHTETHHQRWNVCLLGATSIARMSGETASTAQEKHAVLETSKKMKNVFQPAFNNVSHHYEIRTRPVEKDVHVSPEALVGLFRRIVQVSNLRILLLYWIRHSTFPARAQCLRDSTNVITALLLHGVVSVYPSENLHLLIVLSGGPTFLCSLLCSSSAYTCSPIVGLCTTECLTFIKAKVTKTLTCPTHIHDYAISLFVLPSSVTVRVHHE